MKPVMVEMQGGTQMMGEAACLFLCDTARHLGVQLIPHLGLCFGPGERQEFQLKREREKK